MQPADALAALSVALTWGATVLAVIFAFSAFGYGLFLRQWVKREAREGAAEYLRSAEGQAALRQIAAAEIAAKSLAPPLVIPTRRGS